jgi:hypothetical protein
MDVMDGLATKLGRVGNSKSDWKIASYKAVGSATVKTRSNRLPIGRFNGSSAGRDALYVAIGRLDTASIPVAANTDGSARPAVTPTTAQLAGNIDFARSSSGPSGARADGVVTYIPFGIDAMTYATSPNSKIPSGIPIGTDGNTSEVSLKNIFKGNITKVITNASGEFIKLETPNYVPQAGETQNTINAYIPQAGSGTRSFWIGSSVINITEAQIAAGSTAAKDQWSDNGVLKPVQEHDGSAVANDNFALVGFSIAQFVAQTNGVSPSRLKGAVLRTMAPTAGGEAVDPTTGTGTNLVTNPNWVAIKRTVYNIVPTALANAAGTNAIKRAFVGENSLVCKEKATIQKYGYGLLTYPGTAEGNLGTTSGGHATICGNITAPNRVGAPATSTVSLGTPKLSSSGSSATVVATVTSNGNQGGVVNIYDGAAEAANLVGKGTVAKGKTTVTITVQPKDKKDEELSLIAKFTPTLTGIAESTFTAGTPITVKGETVLSATAKTVSSKTAPTVSVTVKNGTKTSTSFASGMVTVIAVNSTGSEVFIADGTLANGKASVKFANKFPKGKYSIYVRYAGSTLNVAGTIKTTLVVK